MLAIRSRGGMLFVCVSVGLVLLTSKYRNNVLRSVEQLCHGIAATAKAAASRQSRSRRKNSRSDSGNDAVALQQQQQQQTVKVSPSRVILADSPEQCDYAVQRIRCNLSDGVLGFDCEWVNEGPVSLLQLATNNGVCALFRLGKIGHVPPMLKELLTSSDLLKVGVAPYEDGRKIARDYDCQVLGTVDLRILANRLGLPSPKSLAALCSQYLGVEIEKLSEVRCGDWNADSLTDEQIAYASTDAYVSVLVYHQILRKARQKRTLWQSIVFYIKSLQRRGKNDRHFDVPHGVIDARFKVLKENLLNSNSNINNKIGQLISRNSSNDRYMSSIPARNKPLYHNCYLQAPDGEILCTCDKKKAEWYVSKQLGEVVEEDPFTVRLKFEPSGRALGEVGKYYTQVKLNQCVVCGTSDKFIRKNVVPREYRKYFPLVMKSHQSHDVLLLCPACHQVSNCHDLQLRRKLADLCEAPLSGPVSHVRDEIPRGWKMLQSAVRILRDGTPIPPQRKRELELYIMKFTGHREVTPSLLQALYEQLKVKHVYKNNIQDRAKKHLSSTQTKSQPHGLKVVQYFQNRDGGLIELEKLWREHFLNTMNPKFLPELWSVSHNQERLNIRQIQNRIEPSDAKIAGIRN